MLPGTQITVRALPDGIRYRGMITEAKDGRFEFELEDEQAEPLVEGTLLELRDLKTMILATLAARRSPRVSVIAEHTVDLEQLARIRNGWSLLQNS